MHACSGEAVELSGQPASVAVLLLVRFLDALPAPLLSGSLGVAEGGAGGSHGSGESARETVDADEMLRELESVAAVDDESVRSALLAGLVTSLLDAAARH